MPTTVDDVRDFLAQRRIALVGLSRNPKDFSHVVFREMSRRGYDMVPVNPAAGELEGRPNMETRSRGSRTRKTL